MFKVNDDNSIYVTRGDFVVLRITAEKDGVPFTFKQGDKIRFNLYEKKNADAVVYSQEVPVEVESEEVMLYIPGEDTKIGEIISKPVDYWYEVELVTTLGTRTIIGYDEDGAKIFKLFPESAE
jgi:hypothetical protein